MGFYGKHVLVVAWDSGRWNLESGIWNLYDQF
jgi:hypothetical protein